MNAELELVELSQDTDTDTVRALLDACRDYVELETGHPPTNETVTEFFEDHPPAISRDNKLLLAVKDDTGTPIGLADILYGYPDGSDWYIGFLGIDCKRRGESFGKLMLDRIIAMAHASGAKRVLLCVLEDNPRAQAFWRREGFVFRQTTPPWTAGSKTHIRHELVRYL